MNTRYEVVKTSTGKFRIKFTYDNGMTGFCGGKHSRLYCFSTLEIAEQCRSKMQKSSDDANEYEKKEA